MLSNRAKRMKNHIVDCFIQLLKVRSFADITVKEICEKADISRGSFYRYFQDKYSLIQAFMERITNEVEAESKTSTYPEKFRKTIDCIDRHSLEFKNLLLGTVDYNVHLMMHRIYSKNVRSELEKKMNGNSMCDMPTYLISDFISAGIAYIHIHHLLGDYTLSNDLLSEYIVKIADRNGLSEHND